MKKKLAKYLANYLQVEFDRTHNNLYSSFSVKVIEQGIEAFESTEQMVVEVHPE